MIPACTARAIIPACTARGRSLLRILLLPAAGALAGGCAVVEMGNAVSGVADQVTGSITGATPAPGGAAVGASSGNGTRSGTGTNTGTGRKP